MTTNYHSPWEDGITSYSASDMNAPLSELDTKITLLDRKIWHFGCNYLNAVPESLVLLMQVIVPKYMLLYSGDPIQGCYAYCSVAPTGDFTCVVRRNTVGIALVEWGAGENVGVVSTVSNYVFYPGDILDIIAQVTPDATIMNISISLRLFTPAACNTTTTT
jgi:hypothetical protein